MEISLSMWGSEIREAVWRYLYVCGVVRSEKL